MKRSIASFKSFHLEIWSLQRGVLNFSTATSRCRSTGTEVSDLPLGEWNHPGLPFQYRRNVPNSGVNIATGLSTDWRSFG
ncbi:MAG: hypothetical protein O2856_04405 [Planctomycetota bacterium]|nr:hypothetical protein [Planctomycetota bacterium]